MIKFIDTHCHIYSKKFTNNVDFIINNALSNNVDRIICVGVDLSSSEECITLADKYKEIFATVGIHPHESGKVSSSYLKNIEDFSTHPKVIGIGEIGLDYYYNFTEPSKQKEVLMDQLLLAKDLQCPVIIHNRESDDDLYEIIINSKHTKGVIHCFASTLGFAKKIIKLGYFISFTGLITFVEELKIVVNSTPLDKFLLETDSPYLSPIPKRGKINEPANIPIIANEISKIKKVSVDTIMHQTTKNALSLFQKIK